MSEVFKAAYRRQIYLLCHVRKRLKDPETGRVVHNVRYRGTLSQFFRLENFPFDAQVCVPPAIVMSW